MGIAKEKPSVIILFKKHFLLVLISLFVFFCNQWIWIFIREKKYFEIILTIAITYGIIWFDNVSGKIKYLILFFPFIYFLLNTNITSQSTIFTLTGPEIYEINTNRSYYSSDISRFFENKVTYSIDKLKRNIFDGLDINFYFFSSHPREKGLTNEYPMFLWFFLPVFLIGLYSQVDTKKYLGILYFSFVLFLISLFGVFEKYYYLVFPFIIVSLTEGFEYLFNTYERHKK